MDCENNSSDSNHIWTDNERSSSNSLCVAKMPTNTDIYIHICVCMSNRLIDYILIALGPKQSEYI